MVTELKLMASRINWLGMAVVAGILLAWQLVVATGIITYSSFPAPTAILDAFVYLSGHGILWPQVAHTLRCVFISWSLAVLIGSTVGLLIGLNKTAASWGTATIDLLRSLPVLVLIPIGILIWGPATQTEIIIGTYAGLWPMILNTAGGVRSVSPRLREVAATMGLSRAETLFKIVVPSTSASMLVGARLALSSALIICVVAEMLGLQAGVGNLLVLQRSADQPERMWAFVLTVGILGLLVNVALNWLVRLVSPGIYASMNRTA